MVLFHLLFRCETTAPPLLHTDKRREPFAVSKQWSKSLCFTHVCLIYDADIALSLTSACSVSSPNAAFRLNRPKPLNLVPSALPISAPLPSPPPARGTLDMDFSFVVDSPKSYEEQQGGHVEASSGQASPRSPRGDLRICVPGITISESCSAGL